MFAISFALTLFIVYLLWSVFDYALYGVVSDQYYGITLLAYENTFILLLIALFLKGLISYGSKLLRLPKTEKVLLISLLLLVALSYIAFRDYYPQYINRPNFNTYSAHWWKTHTNVTTKNNVHSLPVQLPGPSDAWAGGEVKKVTIVLKKRLREGKITFRFPDSHNVAPPTIVLKLGDKVVHTFKAPPGTGSSNPRDWTKKGHHTKVEIPLSGKALDRAKGVITIENVAGSWVALGQVDVYAKPNIGVARAVTIGWAVFFIWTVVYMTRSRRLTAMTKSAYSFMEAKGWEAKRFIADRRTPIDIMADNDVIEARKNAPLFARVMEWPLVVSIIMSASFIMITTRFITDDWPRRESYRYYPVLELFKEAFENGIWYPRWLPDLYGGYGYPTFDFYQPGYFFISLPFTYIFGDPISQTYFTILFLFFVGGMGAYLMCREVSTPAIGLWGAILFLLTPYMWVNCCIREDLSEFASMVFCPYGIFFIIRLLKLSRHTVSYHLMALVGLSFAAVMFMHPATALVYFPAATAFGIALALLASGKNWRKRYIAQLLFSVALGAVLSSPYWLTVFSLKPYVNLSAAVEGSFSHKHFIQTATSLFWDGMVGQDLAGGWAFGHLGLPHFLLAVAGVIAGAKNRMFLIAFFTYVGLIFFMTSLANVFWENIDLVRLIQFRYRLLAVITTFQVLCAAGIVHIYTQKTHRQAYIIVFALCSVVLWHHEKFKITDNLFPQLSKEELQKATDEQLADPRPHISTFANVNEFAPLTSLKEKRAWPHPGKMLEIYKGEGAATPTEDDSKFFIRYDITSPGGVTILINQVYFPGWRILVDEKPVDATQLEKSLMDDGLIRFPVEKGVHTIEAFYAGPPGALFRNIIIGVIVSLFFIAWISRFGVNEAWLDKPFARTIA